MKIVIETSTLVSASICWKYNHKNNPVILKHHFFKKCSNLFEISKVKIPDNLIITKTVEEEAKNALKKAVISTIQDNPMPNLVAKYGLMVLQHLVFNDALDRLDNYVEEYSIRFPVDKKERERVKTKEVEPFIREISQHTLRYIQPEIPNFISKPLRDELTAKIVHSLPSKGTVYKGMPGDKDLTIMSEAAMIARKFGPKEKIYVASVDNHFKPNPVQVGSWHNSSMHFTGDLDSTVRDMIAQKFGFISEDPKVLVEYLQQ